MRTAAYAAPLGTEHGFAVRVEVVAGHHRLVATAPHTPGGRYGCDLLAWSDARAGVGPQ